MEEKKGAGDREPPQVGQEEIHGTDVQVRQGVTPHGGGQAKLRQYAESLRHMPLLSRSSCRRTAAAPQGRSRIGRRIDKCRRYRETDDEAIVKGQDNSTPVRHRFAVQSRSEADDFRNS
jgi:hypothetical protein